MGALALGGDAVNGKTENGRYYVANHGKLTEVSAAAFNYSRVHCYSVWTTHPLSMFCAYQLYRQKRRAERCED